MVKETLFSFEFSKEWQERFVDLQAHGRRAVPYVQEGVDRVLFSFRRDRVVPRMKQVFHVRGGLSRVTNKATGPHGWRVARSNGKRIQDVIGRVYIASKAAYAHEYGARIKGTDGGGKNRFLAIFNPDVIGALTKTGRISKAHKARILNRSRHRKSENVFVREYKPGRFGLFRTTGIRKGEGKYRVGYTNKRGKEIAGGRTEFVARLEHQVYIRPKMGIRQMWTAYGPEIEKRMLEQYALYYYDWVTGTPFKRGRVGSAAGKNAIAQSLLNDYGGSA